MHWPNNYSHVQKKAKGACIGALAKDMHNARHHDNIWALSDLAVYKTRWYRTDIKILITQVAPKLSIVFCKTFSVPRETHRPAKSHAPRQINQQQTRAPLTSQRTQTER